MMRSLSVLPLALILGSALPVLSRADETADECRKMAVEEEVAPEDLEDYIAECLAVIQSEGSEDTADTTPPEEEAAAEPGSVHAPAEAPGKKP
jgi:hypothetical protein